MSNLTGEFEIFLHTEVEDSITGFKGFVTGRVEYITGCRQYFVQPKVQEDGKYTDGHWFDEDRVRPPAQVVQAEHPVSMGIDNSETEGIAGHFHTPKELFPEAQQ